MPRQVIAPEGVHGTTGYSHAVKKSGTPVFISGQVALDRDNNLIGAGDIAAQTDQVFQNLKAVVEGCGGTMADIVKLTVFVTDLSHRPAIAAARQKYFPDGVYPASTFLVVSSLATPQFLVEIEAVAVVL